MAAKYLSREDSRVLGVIGASNMARSHAEAICTIRPIKRIKVYSLRPQSRENFANELEARLGVKATAVTSAEEAFAESDIVSTRTDSPRPFVRSEWISAGTFVSSVRPFGEVGREPLKMFDIAVAHERGFGPQFQVEEAAKTLSLAPMATRVKDERDLPSEATLADLCAGKVPGRVKGDQRTYFANNEGHGLQFSCLGAFVIKRAKERRLGRELPSEWFLQEITT